MLTHLSIRNFVLVDNISLDFKAGLSVITGESGAGKSILINAMGLALGERGSPSLVREGSDKIEINAIFDISQLKQAQEWLNERDLLADNDCILRRIIAAGGASRAFINGTPVTLDDVKRLGNFLVSIQGQHAHQVLLHKQNHVHFIDDYGKLSGEASTYTDAYSNMMNKKKELAELRNFGKNDTRTMDLLRHELDELERNQFSADEYKQLEEDHHRLNNAGDLLATVRNCLLILDGDDAVAATGAMDGDIGDGMNDRGNGMGDSMGSSVGASKQPLLNGINELSSLLSSVKDKKLNAFTETLSQAEILLREVADELQNYTSNLDIDSGKLEELNTKISEAHRLARKHNIQPEQLVELREERQKEWENLDQLDARIQEKEQEIATLTKECRAMAANLTAKRKEVAQQFNKETAEQLAQLQMNCRFATKFTYMNKLSPAGDSDIEFLLATTPMGQLLALKSIASGGELSRAALAISKVVARHSAVPVLIFDEADSGIGGKAASRVGQSLAELGLSAQIICITHQPQSAVYGNNHYAVVKSQNGKEMLSKIRMLTDKEKQQEIARMVSGEKLEQDALNYAAKLLHEARLNETAQVKQAQPQ